MGTKKETGTGERTRFGYRPWATGYSPRELGYPPTDSPHVPKGGTGQMPPFTRETVPRTNGKK